VQTKSKQQSGFILHLHYIIEVNSTAHSHTRLNQKQGQRT